MTAVTIQFEDKMFTHLKQKADNIGYSIDNYILYLLERHSPDTEEACKDNSIDLLLDSMQFHSGTIPTEESGKGAVAMNKYM